MHTKPDETTSTILWRRLDVEGLDACRLEPLPQGWRLSGTATFVRDGTPACVTYDIEVDNDWHTSAALVHGWFGDNDVVVEITRPAAGGWVLDGMPVPAAEGCVALDFDFTPATTLLLVRQLGLEVGAHAVARVLWLDVIDGHAEPLEHRYERRSTHEYWYEAPRFAYEAMLEVDAAGFVTRCPGRWEAVSE